jgi:hypothetical protein
VYVRLRPSFNLNPRGELWPQGLTLTLRVKLSPRDELWLPRVTFDPQGWPLTPRDDLWPPGMNFDPQGWALSPRGEILIRPSILLNTNQKRFYQIQKQQWWYIFVRFIPDSIFALAYITALITFCHRAHAPWRQLGPWIWFNLELGTKIHVRILKARLLQKKKKIYLALKRQILPI